MSVLPIIDLLILTGWTSLLVGFAQKAIWMSTAYRPRLLTLTPTDFMLVGAVCLLFALALSARTWVKLNEPRILERGRQERARRRWDREDEGMPEPEGSGGEPRPREVGLGRL